MGFDPAQDSASIFVSKICQSVCPFRMLPFGNKGDLILAGCFVEDHADGHQCAWHQMVSLLLLLPTPLVLVSVALLFPGAPAPPHQPL